MRAHPFPQVGQESLQFGGALRVGREPVEVQVKQVVARAGRTRRPMGDASPDELRLRSLVAECVGGLDHIRQAAVCEVYVATAVKDLARHGTRWLTP